MNEPKFTKGEWIFKHGIVHDDSAHKFPIAQIPEHWNDSKANAHLICAAPNIFHALQSFVDNVDEWLKTGEPANPETSKAIYDEAKMALMKALGDVKL